MGRMLPCADLRPKHSSPSVPLLLCPAARAFALAGLWLLAVTACAQMQLVPGIAAVAGTGTAVVVATTTTGTSGSFAVTFSKQELATRPLLELLERAGVKIGHARQRISAGLATPDVAKALDVRTGSPLIELVRVVSDRSGRAVEHLHALYRPDRYAFEMDLVRSGAAAKTWSPVMRRAGRRSNASVATVL